MQTVLRREVDTGVERIEEPLPPRRAASPSSRKAPDSPSLPPVLPDRPPRVAHRQQRAGVPGS